MAKHEIEINLLESKINDAATATAECECGWVGPFHSVRDGWTDKSHTDAAAEDGAEHIEDNRDYQQEAEDAREQYQLDQGEREADMGDRDDW